MNERDETGRLVRDPTREPGAARPDRSTLVGCLGILLVLSLPALLFLPFDSWNIPNWLGTLIPLVAVVAVALGVWLLAMVPGRAPARSFDPRHPLTNTGQHPLAERPAGVGNRLMLLLMVGFILCALVGYFLVSFSEQRTGVASGTILASVAGGGLLICGGLAMQRLLPSPAWRWVRTPIQSGLTSQALPMIVIGLVTFVWAIFIAASEGYVWAPLGVGLLILGSALGIPILQRLPNRRQR